MRSKKAISPIIGIVLILATTIAIGAFASVWLGQVARTQTEATAALRPECPLVYLTAKDSEFELCNAKLGTFKTNLENTGSANVTVNEARILYTYGETVLANKTSSGLPLTILAGDKLPLLVSNTTAGRPNKNISYVLALTDCPNANVEVPADKISFTRKYPPNLPREVWNATYDGGYGSDEAGYEGVAVDSQDNVVVTGYAYNVTGFGDTDFFTIKYDREGNELWNRSRHISGSDSGYGAAVDGADNAIVVGRSVGLSALIVIKYTPNGTELWARNYSDSTYLETAYDVAITQDDNIIVVGAHRVVDGDWWILALDEDGNELWNVTYDGGYGNDYAYAVAIDSTGNIAVAGTAPNISAANDDFLIIKYNSTGGLLWSRFYDGGDVDYAMGVAVDSQDNIIATGYFHNITTGNEDWLTIKYDSTGNVLWSDVYDSGYDDEGWGVAIDSVDNVITAGFNYLPYDHLTIKYDSAGNLLWTVTYDSGYDDWAYAVAVDSYDDMITAGGVDITTYDYLTVKYTECP